MKSTGIEIRYQNGVDQQEVGPSDAYKVQKNGGRISGTLKQSSKQGIRLQHIRKQQWRSR